MFLVDTSVWIGHLHRADAGLVEALESGLVLGHPMVHGELALGSLRQRSEVLGLVGRLRRTEVASHDEVLTLVERHSLHGRGLALVGAHLLAAARLSPGVTLWTRDRRLRAAARDIGVPVR